MSTVPWPQLSYVVLLALGLGIAMDQHGKPKTGRHNFAVTLIATIIAVLVLWWGGFWAPLIGDKP